MTASTERTGQNATGGRAAWLAWSEQRETSVTGPAGNLALVDFQPVTGGPATIAGMPAEVWRNPEEAGVRVRPLGPGIELAGTDPREWSSVTEETFVERLGANGVPLLRSGNRVADAFSLDGSDYELRLYDTNSAKLATFAGIERYDFDPEWRITGTLNVYAETAKVPWAFTRSSDAGHTKSVPGTVSVEIAGEAYEFTVFADGGQLVLVFADGTTGRESYAPGRFLRFDPPTASGDRVELDFNRAFVPPCGFSDFYSCPIPPAENRVSAPVRAGEQRVLWRD